MQIFALAIVIINAQFTQNVDKFKKKRHINNFFIFVISASVCLLKMKLELFKRIILEIEESTKIEAFLHYDYFNDNSQLTNPQIPANYLRSKG